MLLSHWFCRSRRAAAAGYRPGICVLEDRTVPSGVFIKAPPVSPPVGPATHFQVAAPAKVTAGHAFDVVVDAEDARSHVATGFTGTVEITLAIGDGGAALPADFTFRAGDKGVHVFQISLSRGGSQVIKVADISNMAIAGSTGTVVSVPAPNFNTLQSTVSPSIPVTKTDNFRVFNSVTTDASSSTSQDLAAGLALLTPGYSTVGGQIVMVPGLNTSPIASALGSLFSFGGYQTVGSSMVMRPGL